MSNRRNAKPALTLGQRNMAYNIKQAVNNAPLYKRIKYAFLIIFKSW